MFNLPTNRSNLTKNYYQVSNIPSTKVFGDTPAHPIFTPYNPHALSFPLAFQIVRNPAALPQAFRNFLARYPNLTIQYYFSVQNYPIHPSKHEKDWTQLSLRAHPWVHPNADNQDDLTNNCDVAVFSADQTRIVFEDNMASNLKAQRIHTHNQSGYITASPNNLGLSGLKANVTRVVWTGVVNLETNHVAVTQHYLLSDEDHLALKKQLMNLTPGEVTLDEIVTWLVISDNHNTAALGLVVQNLVLVNSIVQNSNRPAKVASVSSQPPVSTAVSSALEASSKPISPPAPAPAPAISIQTVSSTMQPVSPTDLPVSKLQELLRNYNRDRNKSASYFSFKPGTQTIANMKSILTESLLSNTNIPKKRIEDAIVDYPAKVGSGTEKLIIALAKELHGLTLTSPLPPTRR